MIFVVDIGNSRIKWGSYADRRVRGVGQAAYDAAAPEAALEAAAGAVPAAAERVVVATVARAEIGDAFDALLQARGRPAVELAATRLAACGVRCGYADPARLGVDRWAALIGAHAARAGPVVVVDAGTTVTVDVLAADGRHAGGLILAGPALVTEILAGRTARVGAHGVDEATRPAPDELFGHDTRTAVVHGALLAAAAAVDRAVAAAAGLLDAAPHVILTGGLGATLAAWLETAVEHRPALVLEGLGRLVEAGEV